MKHSFYTAKGQRAWHQSRGNYLGGQAYSTSSYSDGYSYPIYVRGLVNSGFTGLAWAPEVRYATCDADYARRVQLMLLGSQSQFNAWEHGDLPFDCRGEMWNVFKRHYDLRARLLPYIYTAFFRMTQTGFPVVAPLPLAFPDDVKSRNIDDQFLLGPSLMVAPAGLDDKAAITREVHFPSTLWYQYWNQTIATTAATTQKMDTPIGYVPLYVRGGSIVPMLLPVALPSKVDLAATRAASGAATNATAGVLELIAALDGPASTCTGELFLDDFATLHTVGTATAVHVVFSIAASKLVANVSHASSGSSLNAEHGVAGRTLYAVDTVQVWGIKQGSVSKVTLSIRGAAPSAVPKSQWKVTSKGLQISGLEGASIKGGGGIAFELKWV